MMPLSGLNKKSMSIDKLGMASTMKYAVNSNYFRNKCTKPEIVQMAIDAGLDGVEWGLGKLDTAAADAQEMHQLTSDAGLEVLGFINAGTLWKYDEIRRWSDAVAAVGAKTLRVAHPWYAWDYKEVVHQRDSYLKLMERTRVGLENLQALGREYNLRYVVETHSGAVAASPYSIYVLMKDLDPATVGAIYDPANTVLEGMVRPNGAVELLGKFLAYVHAKNLEIIRSEKFDLSKPEWTYQCRTLQHGMVNYCEVAYALKQVKYDGWFSFEEPFAAAPAEAVVEFRNNVSFLKECFAAAPDMPVEPYITFND
jgi:sugar phosphate isomerase/epimerase